MRQINRKKKPISMIKALEVRDRIYHKKRRLNIKNELFAKEFNCSRDKLYDPKKWEHLRDKVILNIY